MSRYLVIKLTRFSGQKGSVSVWRLIILLLLFICEVVNCSRRLLFYLSVTWISLYISVSLACSYSYIWSWASASVNYCGKRIIVVGNVFYIIELASYACEAVFVDALGATVDQIYVCYDWTDQDVRTSEDFPSAIFIQNFRYFVAFWCGTQISKWSLEFVQK